MHTQELQSAASADGQVRLDQQPLIKETLGSAVDTPSPEATVESTTHLTPKDLFAIYDRTKGATIVIENGVPKSGVPQEADPEQRRKKPAKLSTIAATIVHGVIAYALKGHSELEQQAHIDELHADSPRVYRGWAERANEIVPAILEKLRPPAGHDAIKVPEPQFYASRVAKESAAVLNETLIKEQEGGDGTPGPFERAVLAYFRSPKRKLDGRPLSKALRQLPKDFALTKKDIKSYLHNARSLHISKDGKTVKLNTTRPDILQVEFKETDDEARRAGGLVADVFRSNIGFAPDELANSHVYYTVVDRQTGETFQMPVSKLVAVHWATSLMAEGRLSVRLVDTKVETHVGKPWKKFAHLYNEHRDDIAQLFTPQNLKRKESHYLPIQDRMEEYAKDLSKSERSLLEWIFMSEREFQVRFGSDDPPNSYERIRNAISPEVLQIDFDITNTGEGIPLGADPDVGYKTIPEIHQAGVPKKVTMALNTIEPQNSEAWMQAWDIEVRHQAVSRHIGKLATRERIKRQQQHTAV